MPPQRQHAEASDPDRLIGPAEFARLLDHKDTTTLSHWITNPPPDFPEPDDWEQLPTRLRPKWKYRRARAYADTHPQVNTRRSSRGGRPAGSTNTAPRPDRDPRADEVAGWLAEAASGTRPPVTRHDIEEHYAVPDYTARRILQRARQRHQDR